MLTVQKDQFDAALEYLGNIGDQPVDWKKFEKVHGVGVEVSASSCAPLCTHVCHGLMLLVPFGGPSTTPVLHVMDTGTHDGITIQVSPEDIRAAVEAELEQVKDKLVAER
jgi:hypothetical protein